MNASNEQRRHRRADVELRCTLRRPVGRPIAALTQNVGVGGMLVSSPRPLAVDEALDFELAELDDPVRGHARVLRHERLDVYALSFEGLPEEMTSCLRALAGAA